MPGQPLQPQPPAPYTIRPGQPQDQPQPIYLVAQPPAAAPVYQVPPGAQLVAGPDGRPAYLYPTEQPQVGPTVSPLLVNLALGTVVLLGIGAACWMVAALVTALAALIKALAILALVLVGGTNASDLSLANAYLLPSVACVIIGGTSIFGGRGGYAGTIVGALILTVLTSLLTLLDVTEPVKQILYGAIILLLAAAYARLTE